MKLKQLSLFLENKPGALSAPVKLLAAAKINILTLSIAEARQYGILRLIVRDWEAAKRLLEKNGLLVKVTDVLAIEVAEPPGGLAEVAGRCSKTPASTWNTCTPSPSSASSKGMLLFRFDDPDKAIRVLQKNKIHVVGNAELFKRLEG